MQEGRAQGRYLCTRRQEMSRKLRKMIRRKVEADFSEGSDLRGDGKKGRNTARKLIEREINVECVHKASHADEVRRTATQKIVSEIYGDGMRHKYSRKQSLNGAFNEIVRKVQLKFTQGSYRLRVEQEIKWDVTAEIITRRIEHERRLQTRLEGHEECSGDGTAQTISAQVDRRSQALQAHKNCWGDGSDESIICNREILSFARKSARKGAGEKIVGDINNFQTERELGGKPTFKLIIGQNESSQCIVTTKIVRKHARDLSSSNFQVLQLEIAEYHRSEIGNEDAIRTII